MSDPKPRPKIEQIWDLVIDLDESGDMSGKISYQDGSYGYGRITATLDGRRVSVYIEEADHD